MFSIVQKVIKGMVISLGFLLPGVSGGALAAILGVYERLISFLANIKLNFKSNVLFFLPIGVGGLLGIALFSYSIEFLLEHYEIPTLWGFSGGVLGTIPSLLNDTKQSAPRNRLKWGWIIGAFIISFLLVYSMSRFTGNMSVGFISYLLAGALIALGVLLPGLSPSSILLCLGVYTPMLNGFKAFDLLGTFFPIMIGGGVTMILLSKGMNYLLLHYRSYIYYCIIGSVLSSTLLILLPSGNAYEGISYANVTGMEIVITALVFVLGILFGLWMVKLEKDYKE